MPSDVSDLTSSELAVLESLHGTHEAVSQRELARRTGLSVGLVNAVIKKLVVTGYVKTAHLNKRQLSYLLTPEGFARTARRSYHYVVDTLRRFQQIQGGIKALIERLHGDGIGDFYLHGEGELAELVACFCAEDGRMRLTRGLPERRWGRKAVVLNASPEPFASEHFRVVDLVAELKNGHTSHQPPTTVD